jgi:hypothetical protein
MGLQVVRAKRASEEKVLLSGGSGRAMGLEGARAKQRRGWNWD